MKIVFLDEATVGQLSGLDKIKSLGEYVGYDHTDASQIVERVGDAEVVITNKVVVGHDIMSACKRLKLICVAATGTNNIDLVAAEKFGIEVKNVAGYSTNSVVQTTFALLMELINHTSTFNEYVHSGEYCRSSSFTSISPAFCELAGKRYGVIGLGSIGRRVAEVAQAFGAEVVYYSTSGSNATFDFQQLSLEELLETSDVVSIHSPLNDATRGLLNYKNLALMKPTAIVINVGRGGIVVEEDLAIALENNIICGAGLDVFTVEPMIKESPLLRFKDSGRLVMTPHIAWASVEARERLLDKIADNIKSSF